MYNNNIQGVIMNENAVSLSELTIKGFKCIPPWNETQRCIIDGKELLPSEIYNFKDLGNFIVITGENASGKSTLAQALFLLFGLATIFPEEPSEKEKDEVRSVIVSLVSKYMGLNSLNDLQYIFHNVKYNDLGMEADEIKIKAVLSYGSNEYKYSLSLAKESFTPSFYVESSAPLILDVIVFAPIYPGENRHSGIFSARGINEINFRIVGDKEHPSYDVVYSYRLHNVMVKDKKLGFRRLLPIEFAPLGYYVTSRLKIVERIQKLILEEAVKEHLTIFIYEEPEIGLHPLLQKNLAEKLLKNTGENIITILLTQSDHLLNTIIDVLKTDNEVSSRVKVSFIDVCQKEIMLKKVVTEESGKTRQATISCIYQKFYVDPKNPEVLIPVKNNEPRSEFKESTNLCGIHSFIKALLEST